MGYFRKWLQSLRFRLTGKFLCDSCRYDYEAACRRPQRPNAVTCPDYKARQ
jgi:hypothetical protein